MQVSETFCPEEETRSLPLITAVIVEPTHRSDTDALIPLIEATQEQSLGPDKVLADALYGSDENCKKAKKLGVEWFLRSWGSRRTLRSSHARVFWPDEGLCHHLMTFFRINRYVSVKLTS